MISPEQIDALRALESLRCGVPNSAAVTMLGTNQGELIRRLKDSLSQLKEGQSSGTGFFIEGGFGTGKSHVLNSLKQTALSMNYACSIVPVSKEMNLSMLSSLFYAAIRELRFPLKPVGGSCAEFLERISVNSPAFARLLMSYNGRGSNANPVFGATLDLYDRYQGEPDIIDYVIDFWDGEKCKISDIKRDLKAASVPFQQLKQPQDSAIALERFAFVADLLQAAGYNGWVILLDEVEMVARLGALARTKSYVNLASLFAFPGFQSGGKIMTIAAISDQFLHRVFAELHDQEMIANTIMIKYPSLAVSASKATQGFLDAAHLYRLKEMSEDELQRIRRRIYEIYAAAYPTFSAPAVQSDHIDLTVSIRIHIKQWVTDLDVRRLYPGYEPHLSLDTITQDLSENLDYETTDEVA